MAFLYLAPVISSTSSLYFAWDQYLFLRIFLKKDIQVHANRLQASYWQTFFPQAAFSVIGLVGITSGVSFYLLKTSGALLQEKGSYNWYLASGVLALCHFFWVPPIKPIINALQDNKKDVDKGTETLRKWIRVHLTRAPTADLGCFICSVVAAVKTLSA
ncbi:hypothetical protein F4811DRAFT_499646 [Daldinia bambusicola]|nr:hypothetical protein F4811DRAFT_499646 [Daldinia bambusicola]